MTCDRGDFTEYSGDPPRSQRPREAQPQGRDRLARRPATQRQREIGGLRRRMQRHPCHQCPDREHHARWAERYWKLKRTIDKMRQQIEHAHRHGRAHLRPRRRRARRARLRARSTTTAPRRSRPSGARCAASTASAICSSPSRCAAGSGRTWMPRPSPRSRAASSTSRGATTPAPGERGLPRGAFRAALQRDAGRSGSSSTTSSSDHRLPGSEPISAGLAQAMHSWARGVPLDRVLDRGRHGRGRLRALGEADHRPARPALDRRRRAARRRPRARRWTPSGAASSRTRSV